MKNSPPFSSVNSVSYRTGADFRGRAPYGAERRSSNLLSFQILGCLDPLASKIGEIVGSVAVDGRHVHGSYIVPGLCHDERAGSREGEGGSFARNSFDAVGGPVPTMDFHVQSGRFVISLLEGEEIS